MERNLPVAAKKIWSMVRVLYFMLRKGILKRKFMLDLNVLMKRGKLAGKALHNLMFHHHNIWSSAAAANRRSNHLSFAAPPRGEYEFSCSNSPTVFPFHLSKNRKQYHGEVTNHSDFFFSCNQSPAADDDITTWNAAFKALELLQSGAASPALPGFGQSPMVRQLRITDSPFPLGDMEDHNEEDSHIDEAAERFIMKFYNDLKKQRT